MRFVICLAGLPREVVDEILRRPAARFTEEKGNTPIARPVREPCGFRAGMSDGFLIDIVERLSSMPATEDVSVVLAYVAYGGRTVDDFVRRFFPFSLIGSLPAFYPNAAPRKERRSALVHYVDAIEKAVGELRDRARIVRDMLSGRNFTPLLLPLRNFESGVLRLQVERLFNSLSTAPDPRRSLEGAAATILEMHPLKERQVGRGRARWFEDDRQLRFKSPGGNRHGMSRLLGEGHRPECLISGRVRLGGPFDSRFHYDCEYERRALNPEYPNCHGASTAPAAKTHVNIAPSDYVR